MRGWRRRMLGAKSRRGVDGVGLFVVFQCCCSLPASRSEAYMNRLSIKTRHLTLGALLG
jgi:hypothetical protein